MNPESASLQFRHGEVVYPEVPICMLFFVLAEFDQIIKHQTNLTHDCIFLLLYFVTQMYKP